MILVHGLNAHKTFMGSLLSGMKRCTGLKCWSCTREGPRLQTLSHTQHISSCDGPQFISVWFIGTPGSAEKCLSKSWLDYKHWLQLNEIRGNNIYIYICFVCKTFLQSSEPRGVTVWMATSGFFALQSRYVAVSFSQSPGRGLTLYEDIV